MRSDNQGKHSRCLLRVAPRFKGGIGNLAADNAAGAIPAFADLRRWFRSADQVRVASGNRVVVFNIGGNNYRLICAVNYNTGKVFLLRFLTPAEYDKDQWKNEL